MSLTVSSLVRYLKNKLDFDENLQNLSVSGEISNFHKHNSGHLYFTLKDDKSSISCVMFSSRAYSLRFVPNNGDKVQIKANASIFETTGQLQLYVTNITKDGLGDLYLKYEELKNKLKDEGLFDENHKKELLIDYPNRVAVVVGDKSAAMSDIKICFNRRWPLANVDYYPCLVQGNDAPKDIIFNLKKIDSLNYDIVILARGGGSFEDLFCFNDEELARTIYNMNTYIITGIGHEQDFTIADFVADNRAPTPTATVELVTPNIIDVISHLEAKYETLNNSLINLLKDYENRLKMLKNNKYLKDPYSIIENKSLKLDYLSNKLENYSNRIKVIEIKIDNLKNKIIDRLINLIKLKSININKYKSILNAYSYENTLKRGYSIIYKDGVIINKKNKLKNNDEIDIKMYKGDIKAVVKGN